MQNKLTEITDKLISATTDEAKLKRYSLIKQMLADDKCFFKLDVNTACSILIDLGFSREDAINIYKELISSKNFN